MFKSNLIANYGGTAFVAATQVLLIPIYVSALGQNDWGLLSVVMALSTSLLILEAGVSLAVARSFSRLAAKSAGGNASFRFIERRYLAVVAAIVLFGILGATPLSRWLLPETTDAELLLRCVAAMASAQILGSLYRSVLVGLGQQVRLNVLLIIFTSLRHAASVSVALLGGGVPAVAGTFAVGFAAEAAFRRLGALRALQGKGDAESARAVRATGTSGTPAIGVGVLAIAGAVGAMGTQADRLLLSRVVDTVTLGHFAIAATLSLAALQLVYPLSSALLPRLESFRPGPERDRVVRRSYAMVNGLIVVIWLGALALTFGGLRLWLPSESIADAVQPMFLVHLVGTTLNLLCVPLYLGLLAQHLDRVILGATMGAFVVQVVVLLATAAHYGALAGSLAWCAGNGTLLAAYFLFQPRNSSDDAERSA